MDKFIEAFYILADAIALQPCEREALDKALKNALMPAQPEPAPAEHDPAPQV